MNIETSVLFGKPEVFEPEASVVVVDIFRASSTSSYILHGGAHSLRAVLAPEESFGIKEKEPDVLLVGEQDGIRIEGFDLGNSPSQILTSNIVGKDVVLRSTSGTPALNRVRECKELIFGSFTTLSAVVAHLNRTGCKKTVVVATGREDSEDEEFFTAFKLKLAGKQIDKTALIERMRKHPRSQRFFQNISHFPEADFELCLDVDRFNFFIRAEKIGGELFLKASS